MATESSYGMKQSVAGQIQKETPLSRLQSAVGSLSLCTEIVSGVASLLAGEAPPEPVSNGEKPPYRTGLFGSIEDIADQVTSIASRINADMARIQRHI